jgi:group I intron endonuclease
LEREQYYLDKLKPEYNILKYAGSSFGYKHTEESKKKMTSYRHTKESIKKMIDSRHSEDFRAKMSAIAKLRRGKETSMYGKNHTIKSKIKIQAALFIPIKIINIKTKKEKIIKGNIQAAKYLNMGESTLRRYKKEKRI